MHSDNATNILGSLSMRMQFHFHFPVFSYPHTETVLLILTYLTHTRMYDEWNAN